MHIHSPNKPKIEHLFYLKVLRIALNTQVLRLQKKEKKERKVSSQRYQQKAVLIYTAKK